MLKNIFNFCQIDKKKKKIKIYQILPTKYFSKKYIKHILDNKLYSYFLLKIYINNIKLVKYSNYCFLYINNQTGTYL